MSTESIRRPAVRPKQAPPTRLEKFAKFARVVVTKLLHGGRKFLKRARTFKLTVPNVLMAVGVVALAGILVLGVTAAVKTLRPAKHQSGQVVEGKLKKSSNIATISEAKFGYLAPIPDGEWLSDPAGEVYDKTTGVVKYQLQRQRAGTSVTVSQQAFPEKLESRRSEKFTEFTNQSKVVLSQEIGNGEVFFMPALENGAPSSGADTVIYATDEVLMFVRSNGILSYGDWVGLLASMKQK